MSSRRPNIVITYSDDQRSDTIGALGCDEIRTPTMDRMCRRGMAFVNAYHGGATVHAVCTPNRVMLFSGRQLFSIPNIYKGWWEEDSERFEAPDPEPASCPMLGEILRRNGYHCFGTGKWHNMPISFMRNFNDGGAIYWCGGNSVHGALRKKPLLPAGRYATDRPEGQKLRGHFGKTLTEFDPTGEYSEYLTYIEPRHTTEAFTEAAVDFLDRYDDDKPFFLYVPYTAPHGPTQTYREWHDMYPPENITPPGNWKPTLGWDNGGLFVANWLAEGKELTEEQVRQRNADHYAITSHMDQGIGRIHEALERNGFLDETIVIHSGDHGKSEGHHGLTGKQSLYDSASKVPLLIFGPDIPCDQVSDALVHQHDLFPTLLEAAGIDVPDGTYFQSLWGELSGDTGWRRKEIFSSYKACQRMVRSQTHKLIEYSVEGRRRTELFDMESDPLELEDLSGKPDQAETIRQLRTCLKQWQDEVRDPTPIL
jgi:arylsulfatase A-like enzyme